ncbi:hypothetical protein BPLS_P5462 [Bathymodiolus platifrons methanotrophic gill symbiont]|nr:hypothetical protein BPLS_P5462 [Bathymodiolus platifrons methanotrophic gill symbiont]
MYFSYSIIGKLQPPNKDRENDDQCKAKKKPAGSSTTICTGELTVQHQTTSYRTLGQERSLNLIYKSLKASPYPVFNRATIVGTNANPTPNQVSASVIVSNIDQGNVLYTDTTGASPSDQLRQSILFDAENFDTGKYTYQFNRTSHFDRSAISSTRTGFVLINNQNQSPIGAGWTIAQVDRLYEQTGEDVMLVEGSGSTRLYQKAFAKFESPKTLSSIEISLQNGMVSGDLNNDGNIDLLITEEGDRPDEFLLYLGDGHGNLSFSSKVNAIRACGFDGFVGTPELEDINNDGNLDIVGTNSQRLTSCNSVGILLGDGNGAFSSPIELNTVDRVFDIVVADLNSNGNLDIVVSKVFQDRVEVFYGDGSGGFSAALNIPVGRNPVFLEAGYFNRDKDLDLIVSIGRAGESQVVLINDGTGKFPTKTLKANNAETLFSYDAENRLIRIDHPSGGLIEYRYDAFDRRIEKNVNGTITRYVYDNEDILFEFDGSDVLQARFTHGLGIDEPLLMQRDTDSNGAFEADESYVYHADGLGSINQLTDSLGGIAQSYAYDSFGDIASTSGGLVNPYLYTSREYDEASGLYYYRARYYDAGLGRFVSEDPVTFPGGDFNQYKYALNNPVMFFDPDGRTASPVGAILTGICTYYVNAEAINEIGITGKEIIIDGFDTVINEIFDKGDDISSCIDRFLTRSRDRLNKNIFDKVDPIKTATCLIPIIFF